MTSKQELNKMSAACSKIARHAGFSSVMMMPCLLAAGAAKPVWKSANNVEIVIGVSPGGGVDRTARTAQKILPDRRMIDVNSVVANKPGGGGMLAQAYLNQHAGDAHYLEVATIFVLTNHITGKSANAWSDFTPIAMLQFTSPLSSPLTPVVSFRFSQTPRRIQRK